jgi:hypothetical protein
MVTETKPVIVLVLKINKEHHTQNYILFLHGRGEKSVQVWWEILKGRDYLEDQDINRRMDQNGS